MGGREAHRSDVEGVSLLEDLERNWEAFGKADPLWAILTLPGTENRRWDEARFFETGRQEIATAFARLDRLGFAVKRDSLMNYLAGPEDRIQPAGRETP